MSEEYAPTLCYKCFSDNHEDCDGVAKIQVNGETFFGTCRCNHRRFKKKEKPDEMQGIQSPQVETGKV